MATTTQLSFKPKQVVKRLLSSLPERAHDILVFRYGLGKDTKHMTLDAIGKKYGITRERVRQIENYGITNIRKSDEYKQEKAVFAEMETLLHSLGGIVVEEDFLGIVSKDASLQNHIHFLLVIGEPFRKRKEDDAFHRRWHVNEDLSKKVEDALTKLYASLDNQELLPESEMVARFLRHLEEVSERNKNQEVVRRWLRLSKSVGRNALGDWGISHSSNIKTKGMRDYAFLVVRKHGSPIHFRDVAKQITQVFNKKAHTATTHNELIKDPRFVLVGRGLYALAEWGYAPGVVRDVIRSVIEKNGPLTKEEVIDKVMKERYVKENTIIVNLQNPKYFKRDKDGRYTPAEIKVVA
ncbi:MAG: sigma factor-like helix-turn-helix DNA-binding protein [Patescibacteria group bacterium]